MAIRTVEFEGQDIHLIGPMDGIQKALTAALHLTRRPERMCLIVGEQGMGKTVGSRLFCSQHPDAVYIQIPPASVMRPGRLLQLLESALEMPVAGAPTLFDRLHGIIAELRQRPRMVVFDNANRIRKYDYIDMLRYVHDEAGARMAFVSIPSLEYVFTSYAEFASRVQIRHHLRPLTASEVAAILTDFPAEVAQTIYEATGGRTRSVMVLAELMRSGVDRKQWSPDAVKTVARSFTLRAA